GRLTQSRPPILRDVPQAIQGRWAGDGRAIPGVALDWRSQLYLTADAAWLSRSDGRDQQLESTARSTTDSQLSLATVASTGPCDAGVSGAYDWVASPGQTILTIVSKGDACAPRSSAFGGTWYRLARKDPADDCLWPLNPRTTPTQFLEPRSTASTGTYHFGSVRYTVATGWANAGDWPNVLQLVPAADYAAQGPTAPPDGPIDEFDLYVQPRAAKQTTDCTNVVDPAV